MGPINPSSYLKSHILAYTNYVTKWVEAKSFLRAIDQVVEKFLHEIFIHFGTPCKIVIDGGAHFTSRLI
jgi:hypothetical protein